MDQPTIKEIAQVLGVTPSAVAYQRKKRGMPVHTIYAACYWWVTRKRLSAPYLRSITVHERATAYLKANPPTPTR